MNGCCVSNLLVKGCKWHMSGPKAMIVRINLTEQTAVLHESEQYFEWIGGRGFGVKIIYDEVKKETHPLAEENKIVVATGCFTGTSLPGASRIEIVTKNLYNNGINYSSGGGDFSPALKLAGVDALIIEGKAKSPVYIYIHDRQIEFRDASDIWGKTTWQTEDVIRDKLQENSVKIAAIGPAGENTAIMACIIIDKAHAAAWGGCGAVLGAKNLKAIVVEPDPKAEIKMVDPERFMMETEKLERVLLSSTASASLKRGGTHAMAGVGGWSGKVPTSARNSLDEYWDPEKNSKIAEEAYKKFEKRRTKCFNCQLACLHWYEMEYSGEKLAGEGMHANSVRGFGSNWDVDDPGAVFKAHILCNKYGLDVDGISAVIAWSVECFEAGIINKKDTGGLNLTWGNTPDLIALIENIVYKRGLGKILAKGVFEASKIIGKNSIKHAMQIKGVGINEQGLRTHKAWSLGVAVSTRGGGHLSGSPQTENRNTPPEIGQWLFNCPDAGIPTSYNGKGKLVAWYEIYKAIIDSIGTCYFNAGWYETSLANIDFFVDMYNALTGSCMTKEEMWNIGKRIINIEKAINTVFAGFSRENDILPEHVMKIPVSDGPYKGEYMEQNKFNSMLDEYYTEHSWDPNTGKQREDSLIELGLGDVAEFLRSNSK